MASAPQLRRGDSPDRVVEGVDEEAEEEVAYQNRNEGIDERLRRGAADPFGAGPRSKPAEAADDCNFDAEEERLRQSIADVPEFDRVARMLPVMEAGHVVDLDGDDRAADDPHEVGDAR